ncbi:hypothetical protein [Ignatzschineria cameli]|uniref:hypothetical protein n=1 Tax=Ignatzschineria cameli TaxID=2182793 RepID=UPI000D61C532|nr:hypothetical protein [Ignatzschineria cameli]PWD87262.1 hypothetical protein DC080_00065 [Ignatzschineria cameli]
MKQALIELKQFFKRDLNEFHWYDYCQLSAKSRWILLVILLLLLSYILLSWTPLKIDFGQRSMELQLQERYQRELDFLIEYREAQAQLINDPIFFALKSEIEQQFDQWKQRGSLADHFYHLFSKKRLEIISLTPTYEREEGGEGWKIKLQVCGDPSLLLNTLLIFTQQYRHYFPEIERWNLAGNKNACTTNLPAGDMLEVVLIFYDFFTLKEEWISQNITLSSTWMPLKANDIITHLLSTRSTLQQWSERVAQSLFTELEDKTLKESSLPFITHLSYNKLSDGEMKSPLDSSSAIDWRVGEVNDGIRFLGLVFREEALAQPLGRRKANLFNISNEIKERGVALFRLNEGQTVALALTFLTSNGIEVDFYNNRLRLSDIKLIDLLREKAHERQ